MNQCQEDGAGAEDIGRSGTKVTGYNIKIKHYLYAEWNIVTTLGVNYILSFIYSLKNVSTAG